MPPSAAGSSERKLALMVTLTLIWCLVSALCSAHTTTGHLLSSAANVVVINQTGYESRTTAIAVSLRAVGVSVEVVASAAFCALESSHVQFVVVPSTPALLRSGGAGCDGAVDTLVRLATSHVGLGLLGGWPGRLNLSLPHMTLAVMSPYEPYQLEQYQSSAVKVTGSPLHVDGASVGQRQSASQDGFHRGISQRIILAAPLRGVSAVGWVNPPESWFVPVVEVVDPLNRTVAWALSVVLHTMPASTFEVSNTACDHT